MTEFDFDELDKAVNLLMKKTPPAQSEEATTLPASSAVSSPTTIQADAPTPQSAAPAEPKQDFQSSSQRSSTPSLSPMSSEPVNTPPVPVLNDTAKLSTPPATQSSASTSFSAERPAPSSAPRASSADRPLPTKRRGSFMDVVHPGSNMRTKPVVATRPVSRQGATIAPTEQEPATMKADATDTPTKPSVPLMPKRTAPTPAPASPVVPRQVDDKTLSSTLTDAASKESATPAPTAAQAPIDDIDALDQELTKALDTAQTDSIESLFISDAKVDKRPLGASASTSESSRNEQQDTKPVTDAPSKTSLPDELSAKVMNIESEHNTKPVASPAKPASANMPGPVNPSPARGSAPVSAANSATTGGSIPQQYQQQKPADHDDDHPAIYDPAYYKQEMKSQKPEKKKSGWWVVIAIASLIVVGGAGGVLYYFYSTGAF